jgi:FAD/FMN-containing dehydrogenase
MRRRDFLKCLTAAPIVAAAPAFAIQQGELVNDVHTGLNPTRVSKIIRPTSVADIQSAMKDCAKRGQSLCVSGSRHAAGGQQFATDSLLVDMRSMNRVVGLDDKSGVLHVEAGIEWPELIQGYLDLQKENARWGIRQKQGGVDRMTLGGTLAANAHGHSLAARRVLAMWSGSRW